MNGQLIKTTEYRHAVSSVQIYGGNQIWRKSQLNTAATTKATTARR